MYRNYSVLTLRAYLINAPITSCHWLILPWIVPRHHFFVTNTLLICNGVLMKICICGLWGLLQTHLSNLSYRRFKRWQFSHHCVHTFIATYIKSLLLFGHYLFIAWKVFGCFKPSHWVPFWWLNRSILFVFLSHRSIMLAYYSIPVIVCRYSNYFGNPSFTSIAYLINDKQQFMLFPSASSVEAYIPTQDFHLLQNVLLVDVIMFGHKTDSFILTYCSFKH